MAHNEGSINNYIRVVNRDDERVSIYVLIIQRIVKKSQQQNSTKVPKIKGHIFVRYSHTIPVTDDS
jgi:hypothetical protein